MQLPEGRVRGHITRWAGCAVALVAAACGEVESTPEPDAAEAGALVDDLDDGDRNIPARDGRIGYWHSLNDGTGSQTPPPQTFAATSGGADGSAYCIATRGEGFTVWGAKIGVYLHHDGEGTPGVYDVGAYTGVRFFARGDTLIRATVLTAAVRGDLQGGTCVESAGGCYDYHGLQFALTDDWREYRMGFAAMAQEGWGQVIDFDPAGAMAIDFSVPAGVRFDFAVDSVRLY